MCGRCMVLENRWSRIKDLSKELKEMSCKCKPTIEYLSKQQ